MHRVDSVRGDARKEMTSTASGRGSASRASARADMKSILRRLRDASRLGDVDSVKDIFDAHGREVRVDTTMKGRNTALHTAVSHKREGPIIDYLIQAGADVNAENDEGYTPLTLAIVHCQGSSAALEKLIAAGARWKEVYDSGAFEGSSALDVAVRYENEAAIDFLACISAKNVCGPAAADEGGSAPARTVCCPVCNSVVKPRSRFSRILDDQAAVEGRIRYNGECIGGKKWKRKRKYIARKYMDELLANEEA